MLNGPRFGWVKSCQRLVMEASVQGRRLNPHWIYLLYQFRLTKQININSECQEMLTVTHNFERNLSNENNSPKAKLNEGVGNGVSNATSQTIRLKAKTITVTT